MCFSCFVRFLKYLHVRLFLICSSPAIEFDPSSRTRTKVRRRQIISMLRQRLPIKLSANIRSMCESIKIYLISTVTIVTVWTIRYEIAYKVADSKLNRNLEQTNRFQRRLVFKYIYLRLPVSKTAIEQRLTTHLHVRACPRNWVILCPNRKRLVLHSCFSGSSAV